MYKNKVIFITGAAGGIGKILCEGYAKAGAQVVAADIKEAEFTHENIEYINMDLGSREDIERVFKEVKERFGRIDILINNGAIAYFQRSVFDLEVEEFDRIISVNLRGTFICSREFLRINKGEEYGRIVNIGSTRWSQGEAGWEAYCASKGGVVSMSQTMAVSLSESKITVNCVSPGWIECFDYSELREKDHSQHPSGRVGRPEDILRACMFLTHQENDFVNGENIVVDGGMTRKMIYED